MSVLVIFGSRSRHAACLLFLLQMIVIAVTTDSLITLRSDLLVLLVQDVRFETKHPRHANRRDDNKPELNRRLTSVERLLWGDGARLKEHGNEHVEKLGDGAAVWFSPVGTPLDDNTDDEVAEDGLEEEHLGNEFCIDADHALEMNVIGQLEADSERHLWRAIVRKYKS